jgi:hypothetical protein
VELVVGNFAFHFILIKFSSFFFFFFFFWWDWVLSSGLYACKAGAQPLEPRLQSILLWLIWK